MRARFRNGFDREALLDPDVVYELTIDLWSTSLVINRGHRIRVAISSSNAPRFDPNPNTGLPLHTGDKTRVATNSLHLSEEHPSRITLPIYAGEEDSP